MDFGKHPFFGDNVSDILDKSDKVRNDWEI
jgi:hypothetical protein